MENNLSTTGAENLPAAGDSAANTGGDAPQGMTGDLPGAAQTDQEGGQKTVPLSVVRTMRDELKNTRDQATLYRRQLELARQGAQRKNPLDGMADDTPLTVGQAKKAIQEQSQQIETLASQLSFSVENPGFAQTIKDHLPQVIKTNPGLLDVIRYSANPLAAAYSIARLSPSAKAAGLPDVASQMNRILENSEKPGSASAASGRAGISAASRISKMSDVEFAAYKEQVKAGKIKIGG